jgi:hemolysin III
MKQNISRFKKSYAVYQLSCPLPFQTPAEEIANAVLHGLGAGLSIAGLVLMVLRANGHFKRTGGAIESDSAIAVTAHVVYTATMICMFLASTLYHAIAHEGAKRVFRVLDHSSIYLLIAGTYTPFCLLVLKGALGWILFGMEWVLAFIGITLFAMNNRFLKKVEVWVYMLMGWAIVFSAARLVHAILPVSISFLLVGGIAYTLGTIWYGRKHRRGSHVIWHVCVLIGAGCHWFSIWRMSIERLSQT